jgi:cathepsin A (carboxypeptidase C)
MKFRTDFLKSFSGYVKDLINEGIPILIYAGDADFICNYLGNKAWTYKLDWDGQKEFQQGDEHDWKGVGLARTAKNFTFLQVFDAGHMVPSDQPKVALDMITDFVNGIPF